MAKTVGMRAHDAGPLEHSVADMANGPIERSVPHPDTVALLEKLGSANSNNCRSDTCLVAPQPQKQRNKGGTVPAKPAD